MLVAGLILGCNGDGSTSPTDSTPTGTHTGDTGPVLITDLFTQDLITPVDILWVIDSSFDVSDAIGDAMEPMWEVLLLADPSWQMGVVAADATGARYGLLTDSWSTWPGPADPFTLGTSGGAPRFDETVYTALELRATSLTNKDFQRSGAALYTIYVTEAEDASNNDTINRRDFLEWYAGLSTNARIAVLTSSAGRSYWRDRTVGGSLFEAGSEKEAVRGAILEATGLATSFTLSQEPLAAPESIEVIFRDHATEYTIDRDYLYDERDRTITFKRVIPPPDAVVRVIYEPASATSSTASE